MSGKRNYSKNEQDVDNIRKINSSRTQNNVNLHPNMDEDYSSLEEKNTEESELSDNNSELDQLDANSIEDNEDSEDAGEDDSDNGSNGQINILNKWMLIKIGLVGTGVLGFLFFIGLLAGSIGGHPDYSASVKRMMNCKRIIVEGDYAGNYDFEEYIAGVVTAEANGFGPETIRAVAIAARNYTIISTNDCTSAIKNSHEENQYFVPPSETVLAEVKKHPGQLMTKVVDGRENNPETLKYDIFLALHSTYPMGEDGSLSGLPNCSKVVCEKGICKTDIFKVPYKNEEDKIEFEMPDKRPDGSYWNGSSLKEQGGHCYGLSSVGAEYLETQKGYDYEQILKYFYYSVNFDAIGGGMVEWDGFEYDCSGIGISWGNEYPGHTGIDIQGNYNGDKSIPVYSLAPGRVWRFDPGTTTLGAYVMIESYVNGSTYLFAYGHFITGSINPNLVIGEEVKADTYLGIQGHSGNTSGKEAGGVFTHVHFETRSPTGSSNFWSNQLIYPPTSVIAKEELPKMYCKRIATDKGGSKDESSGGETQESN